MERLPLTASPLASKSIPDWRMSPVLLRNVSAALLSIGLMGVGLIPGPSEAKALREATIRRIVEGREVFIDRVQARVYQRAGAGQQLSTGKSRAELLFDRKAIGYLGKNSLITLGKECFSLSSGTVLVNGRQNGCLGSKILGVRGTTYVLTREADALYRLSVLHGEARIAAADQALPIGSVIDPAGSGNAAQLLTGAADPMDQDIASLYPRLNPVVDIGSSAYGSNAGGVAIGEALGLVLADAGVFLPLYQAESSRVVYNYTRTSANFDGFWGISSEVGYRWFDPNNRSTNGVLVGYDGWQADNCYQSLVVAAAEWERNRWQLSAQGGVPVDGCENSIGYASAGVGIPIADLGRRPVLLGLAPYVLHGIGESFGGGRVSLSVPIGEHVDLTAYGQRDGLLDTTVGGQVRIRFPVGSHFVNDPNRSARLMPSPLPWRASHALKGPSVASSSLAFAQTSMAQAETAVSDASGWLRAAGGEEVVVKQGEQALLDADGNLIKIERLNQSQFEDLILINLKGMNLLPESRVIGELYARLYGKPAPETLAVTGLDWYVNAGKPMPRPRGANNLVVPQDRLPRAEASPPPPQPAPQPPLQVLGVGGGI